MSPSLSSRTTRALLAVAVGASGLAAAGAPGAASAASATGTVESVRITTSRIVNTCDVSGQLVSTTFTVGYDATSTGKSGQLRISKGEINAVHDQRFVVWDDSTVKSVTVAGGGRGTTSYTVTRAPQAPSDDADFFKVDLYAGEGTPKEVLTSAPRRCGTVNGLTGPTATVSAPHCDGSVDVTFDATAATQDWTPRLYVDRVGAPSQRQPDRAVIHPGQVVVDHIDLFQLHATELKVTYVGRNPATDFDSESAPGGLYFLTTPAAADCAATTRGALVSLPATRLVDTRSGKGAPRAPLAASGTLSVQAAGSAGIPAGATAAVVNLTTTAPATSGYLQAWSAAAGPGTSSVVNFLPGQTISRTAVVALDAVGRFSLRNVSGGSTQVVVDVTGYALGSAQSGVGDLVAMDPTRVLDTRRSGASTPVAPGQTLRVQVAGRAGIGDASSVAVQVTAVGSTTSGFLTSWSGEGPIPGTSSVNYLQGQVVGGLSTVPVAANGTVAVTNTSAGTVHLLVDVEGWWRAGSDTSTGSLLPQSPRRLLDTRTTGGALASGESRELDVVAPSVSSGQLHGVSAVLVNLTSTAATSAGYLQTSQQGVAPGASSALNFVSGRTSSNLALVPVGDNGRITLTNRAPGTTQVVVDVVGYVSR